MFPPVRVNSRAGEEYREGTFMIEHKIDMFRFGWELDKIKEKPVPPPCTLFYGSSTFAIWKEIETIFADYNAVNAGFGGSTSDEALFHYEAVAKPFAPKVLLWYFADNEPVCGYTAEETEELFEATWNRFRNDFPEIKIISVATKTSPARDEYAEYVETVNAWQRKYAAEHDFFTLIETNDICKKDGVYQKENYLPDELHFGPKGYEILEKRIKTSLNSIWN